MSAAKRSVPLRGRLKAPGHLSGDSSALWLKLAGDYGMAGDDAGLAILTSAMEARDRAEQARLVVAAEGVTVADRSGGVKAHPACAVERDARAAFLQVMKALRLDVEPNYARPGRPPGGAR